MIKVTNFLPDDYQKRRLRRRANLICSLIGGGTVLALGLTMIGLFLASLGTAATRLQAEQQYQEASKQIEQLKQLEERKAGLVHKVELSTDLLERVPRSLLLARLVKYLPENTSLMTLAMKLEEIEVRAPESSKKAPEPASGDATKDTAAKAAAKPAMVKVKTCVFHLTGLAPTDVEVAEFMSKLTSDPLFKDVDLRFSEQFPVREGVVMRRFEMNFHLDPGAARLVESAPDARVAAAVAPSDEGEDAEAER